MDKIITFDRMLHRTYKDNGKTVQQYFASHLTNKMVISVISGGYVDVFKYYCNFSNLDDVNRYMRATCIYNNLDMLKCMVEKYKDISPINEFIILSLFEDRKVEILEYLVDQGLKIKESTYELVQKIFQKWVDTREPNDHGHFQPIPAKIEQLLKRIVPEPENVEVIPENMEIVNGYTHDLEYTLRYTDDKGIKTDYITGAKDTQVILEACVNGHLDVLKYFIEHKKVHYYTKKEALSIVAKKGNAELVRYLVNLGVSLDTPRPVDEPLPEWNPVDIVDVNDMRHVGFGEQPRPTIHTVYYDDSGFSEYATIYNDRKSTFRNVDMINVFIQRQDADMIDFLLTTFNICDPSIVLTCIKTDNLAVLSRMFDNGVCKEEEHFTEYVTQHTDLLVNTHSLDMVKFVVERGVKVDNTTIDALVSNKHLDIVKYLVSKSQATDLDYIFDVCEDLDTINMLLELTVKPSIACLRNAGEKNLSDIVKRLIEAGINMCGELEVLFKYVKRGDVEMTKYLFAKITEVNPAVRWLLEEKSAGCSVM